MLKIYLNDGNIDVWKENQFDDYYYDKKVFVVIRNGQWVGVYNMDIVGKVIYG